MSVSRVALLLEIAVAAPIHLAAVEIEGLVHRFENGVTCHVSVVDAHPFLVDHAKVLVLTREGILLEQLRLYPDSGAGAALHVFAGVEPPSEVILIDANGTWVRLDAEGRIRSVLWNWLEPLPDGYLGRMEYVAGGYRLVPPAGVAPDLSAVYVFKDPR